jgi:hypothetical protein
MDERLACARLVGALVVGLLAGCSGQGAQPAAGVGGRGGTGGAEPTGSAAAGAAPCPGAAPAALAAAARVELPIRITVGGTAAVVGEAGVASSGREFRLSLFKFFLSQPILLSADGKETKAQFVNADGVPEPYELHLVDADDAATQILRLQTMPGNYTSLRFGVGVPAACNVMNSTAQVYPLNPDSEMYWDWGSRFMFIRIEGNTRPDATAAWEGFTYHVGFDQAFTTLTVPGAITALAGAAGPTLSLDIERMLETDAATLPSPQHGSFDGWVVDNLDENQAFTLQ